MQARPVAVLQPLGKMDTRQSAPGLRLVLDVCPTYTTMILVSCWIIYRIHHAIAVTVPSQAMLCLNKESLVGA